MADDESFTRKGWTPLRVAIVGGSGFVGQSVVQSIRSAGHEVAIVRAPRLSASARGQTPLQEELSAIGSVLTEALAGQFAGAEVVVNCAGLASPGSLLSDALVGANSLLPGLIVHAASEAGVRRVIHVSSAAVYGHAKVIDEAADPEPASNYGISKLWGEAVATRCANEANVELIIYRPTSVHGPGRKVTERVRKLARSPLSSVAGRGDAPTPQVDVEDVGAFVLELVDRADLPSGPLVHPWTGWTTRSFLEHMGDGNRPLRLPTALARFCVYLARVGGRFSPALRAQSRRLEMLWFGQRVVTANEPRRPHRVIVATTVDKSLGLLTGFPERLAGEGWEVHVVSSGGPRLSGYAEMNGIRTHAIPMKRNPSPVADVRSLVRWLALVRHIRPDVVYLGTPKASLLGILAAWGLRTPVRVYLIRGLRAETVSGLKRRVLLALERLTMTLATDVISVSQSLAARVNELTGHDSVVVGDGTSNGIDTTQFRRRMSAEDRAALRERLGLAQNSYVLGFVGRITDDKGIGDALAALKLLRKEHLDARLLIVGTREAPMSFVSELSELAGFIVEVGETRCPETYLELMDVFLLPSRREGFSNAALEAAAMEVPIVAARSTGIVDFVENGHTGLLVDVGRPEDIARAVAAIRTSPSTRQHIVRSALAKVKRYDRRKVQADYIAYLTQLAQKG